MTCWFFNVCINPHTKYPHKAKISYNHSLHETLPSHGVLKLGRYNANSNHFIVTQALPIVKPLWPRNVIKYGHFRGIQRFFCKDCKRKFADNDALPNMQTPIDQVGAAIGMYYEGQSPNTITRLLTQIYNSYPSDSTVYRWISRFTRQAISEAKAYKPNVGDTWVANETVLSLDYGSNVWFWDIIDTKTRFLLASYISKARTTLRGKI
jgi:transposase-like protein